MTWKQYKGGRRWRVLPDGAIEVEHGGVLRTSGEPLTMRRLLDQHGAPMREASARFGVPLAWLMGMIPIEARMVAHPGGGLEADPVSLRHEPGYASDSETPRKVSAGLMQTLLSTARDMARRHGLPSPQAARDLYDPRTSIMLGAAYMAYQRERYNAGVEGHSFDFVHMTGAYNAGSVRADLSEGGSPFHLVTYSPTRTERAIRWHNDALAVLRERGEGVCHG